MNNAVFEKNHEENEKKKNTSKFQQPKKKNYLVTEPNFNTRNFLSANLLAIEMKKAQILLNKLV